MEQQQLPGLEELKPKRIKIPMPKRNKSKRQLQCNNRRKIDDFHLTFALGISRTELVL